MYLAHPEGPGTQLVIQGNGGAYMCFHRDTGTGSTLRCYRAGFPIAALPWRVSGTLANWSTPIEESEIAHILPEGPKTHPSR
jgi:hypothetical protein